MMQKHNGFQRLLWKCSNLSTLHIFELPESDKSHGVLYQCWSEDQCEYCQWKYMLTSINWKITWCQWTMNASYFLKQRIKYLLQILLLRTEQKHSFCHGRAPTKKDIDASGHIFPPPMEDNRFLHQVSKRTIMVVKMKGRCCVIWYSHNLFGLCPMMKLFQHGHGFGDHVELKQEFYLLASFGQEEGMQPFQPANRPN